MTVAVKSPADVHHKPVIDEVMRRARAAFEAFRDVEPGARRRSGPCPGLVGL